MLPPVLEVKCCWLTPCWSAINVQAITPGAGECTQLLPRFEERPPGTWPPAVVGKHVSWVSYRLQRSPRTPWRVLLPTAPWAQLLAAWPPLTAVTVRPLAATLENIEPNSCKESHAPFGYPVHACLPLLGHVSPKYCDLTRTLQQRGRDGVSLQPLRAARRDDTRDGP